MTDPVLLTAMEVLGTFGVALLMRYLLPLKKNESRGPSLQKGGPRFA